MLLELKGNVPEYLKGRILAETDDALLEAWLRTAAEAETVEAFMRETGLEK